MGSVLQNILNPSRVSKSISGGKSPQPAERVRAAVASALQGARLGSDVRLERRARRRHERRGPARGRGGREVGRRRARVARAPAVLVEILGAAHRVAALDAALRHAVLALELGGAPGALAPPHHVPLALLQLAEALALAQAVGALRALGAAVQALGAQHARRAALGLAGQRLRALQLGAVRVRVRVAVAVQRRAVALDALGVGRAQRRLVGGRGVRRLRPRVVVVGRGLGELRARVDVLVVVAGRAAVLLVVVVVGAARARAVGLVAAGAGVAVVARQPGGLELVRARGGRHALVALAGGAGRAGVGARAARAARVRQLVGLGLVRVRDAAVVQRRRVVQRAQLLVERARQRGHQVSGSCDNLGDGQLGRVGRDGEDLVRRRRV